jgi:FtsP/CotA-like multicopper oxidase with cupredoxin domain
MSSAEATTETGEPSRVQIGSHIASARGGIRRARIILVAAAMGWAAAPSLVDGAPAVGSEHARPARSPELLRQPPVLRNMSSHPGVVEVTLTAAPARLRLMPGGPLVSVYAYNGTIPGPTLDLREGDSVIIHFRNQLPEWTTVHWHGFHIPAYADGSPLYPIAPGTSHDYKFRLAPGSAGTYWYHPHPDRRTRYQVSMGLFGGIIVRAPSDPLTAKGVPEKLLILSDNRFDSTGAIAFSKPSSLEGGIDLENGREGNVLFVNGQVMPTIPIRRGELQRWRIVNASAARVFRLSLAGQHLVHVGNDGGLFEHAVEVPEVLMANSERVEVLVRGTGSPGDTTVLEDLPYDRYMPQTRPADWDRTRRVLSLRLTDDSVVDRLEIPSTLRPIPPLDTTHVAVRRTIVMSQGLIDGRQMDMHRVDIRSRLGTTEIWTIQNVVGMDHPFHLHGFHFQVLDRDGVPEPFRSWKDTGNVPKHSSIRIAVHFDDYPGKWMFHCHILDHEDDGMMGVLEVR